MPIARHDDATKPDHFNHQPKTSCWLSDDCGQTWHRSKTVLTGKKGPGHEHDVALQEPGVVELKDGRLVMFCRTHIDLAFISYSSDQGETWSLNVPMPGIRAALAAPAIKRIPKTGDLLMVWDDHSMVTSTTHPYYGRRTPFTVGISRDEGKTWEKVKNIEDAPDGWYCYTAIAFVGDHVLLATFRGHIHPRKEPRPRLTSLARPRASTTSVMLWPSMRISSQPKLAYWAARGSTCITSWTAPSICRRLQSMMAITLSSSYWPASMAASQTCPSRPSPSPMMQKILCFLRSSRAARAMPTAILNPWPNDPVETSTPGSLSQWGCPWKGEPNLRSVTTSSRGQNPAKARPRERLGALCPVDQIMRSRSSQLGFWGSWVATLRGRALPRYP